MVVPTSLRPQRSLSHCPPPKSNFPETSKGQIEENDLGGTIDRNRESRPVAMHKAFVAYAMRAPYIQPGFHENRSAESHPYRIGQKIVKKKVGQHEPRQVN